MDELQRAIKWLEDHIKWYGHNKDIAQHCRALLDALRWVPVSEPPKKTGIYLVSLSSQWSPEKGYVYMAKYLGSGEWAVESVPDGTVTHWRPLPAPPEEERTTWI